MIFGKKEGGGRSGDVEEACGSRLMAWRYWEIHLILTKA